MPGNLPLLIQRFGGYDDQCLVLTHITALQNREATASPAQIRAAFISLRLRPPANIPQYLGRLADRELVMRPFVGVWALTPEGLEWIRQLMIGIGDEELRVLGRHGEEPALGDVSHPLIPPELAPAAFHSGIARFIEGHPFDRNVFAMSRFPRDVENDPMERAHSICRDTCRELRMELHLASDRAVEDLLFRNVAAAMWSCRYGIAILEDTVGEGLNYNTVLEVGAMLVTGRRCLLLKDESIPRLPTDLVGHIYASVDLREPESLRAAIHQWIGTDLGIT